MVGIMAAMNPPTQPIYHSCVLYLSKSYGMDFIRGAVHAFIFQGNQVGIIISLETSDRSPHTRSSIPLILLVRSMI